MRNALHRLGPITGLAFAIFAAGCGAAPEVGAAQEFGLVIHGGAGTISPDDMTPEREADYHATLEEALRAGHEILEAGGTSLDAVVAAVRTMEDAPIFNAGRGAVFTHEGTNELDAAIMDGSTRDAGAVAGVRQIRNPITLARMVMERSPHVFMAGEGAEVFGVENDVETVDPDYFFTQERWDALQRAIQSEETALRSAPSNTDADAFVANLPLGTVGAVARDKQGNLAAATSTGGMTNKRFGRIGDVPVIGAGTYADNETCAVSATGHGEYFIRNVVAHDICARMDHLGETLEQAASYVVMERLVEHGGSGGVIAIDRDGRTAMPFNTSGMYRGSMGPDGVPFTAIYQDEPVESDESAPE